METFFRKLFETSIQCKQAFLKNNWTALGEATAMLVRQLRQGNKILFFGNGGSAADAQHLAAEFVNRLLMHRPAIPAIALTTDSSVLTSIANDYAFEEVFARQIEALGKEADIAFALSTSGNSANVIRGIQVAKKQKLLSIGLLGCDGGLLKKLVDVALVVPSSSPQRIQETHITVGHALCEWVEQQLFGSKGCNG